MPLGDEPFDRVAHEIDEAHAGQRPRDPLRNPRIHRKRAVRADTSPRERVPHGTGSRTSRRRGASDPGARRSAPRRSSARRPLRSPGCRPRGGSDGDSSSRTSAHRSRSGSGAASRQRTRTRTAARSTPAAAADLGREELDQPVAPARPRLSTGRGTAGRSSTRTRLGTSDPIRCVRLDPDRVLEAPHDPLFPSATTSVPASATCQLLVEARAREPVVDAGEAVDPPHHRRALRSWRKSCESTTRTCSCGKCGRYFARAALRSSRGRCRHCRRAARAAPRSIAARRRDAC